MALFIVLLVIAFIFVIAFMTLKNSDGKVKRVDNLFKEEKMSPKEAMLIATAKSAPDAAVKSEEDDKVLCDFCGSYVDISENELCPNCGASLKEQIEKYRAKKQAVSLEMIKIQMEMEKERAKREERDKTIDIAKIALLSTISPVAGLARARRRNRR